MNVQGTTAPRCFKPATRDVKEMLLRSHYIALSLMPDTVYA
jgi:hypothetical protein